MSNSFEKFPIISEKKQLSENVPIPGGEIFAQKLANDLFSTEGKTTSCIELGCFAHARRKFFDLLQANNSPMVWEALQRNGKLYAIEAEAKEFDIETRRQLRQEQSQPVLEALHAWLLNTRTHTANGGASAKAMDYTLKRWTALVRYAETGHLPIDNNPVENSIRPI